ncbi:YeeE/YedE family protein [Corallococcus llansteffanensis]|uniref:YeeE/YedE family protein n=1 Tax=Corallococcus llansteffanensis TaxID=2316731 RepID=A0A3A8NIA2_9BACT|nr:YeeE/YedE thiosulfate transporter family protein [Corallococcus llansteffanensis]RKH40885.1 YeeE/YedE family protein [Corallococcus llansteffanensis]
MASSFLLPLLGGALIGLAVSLLLLTHGRVAGVSGVVGALLAPVRGDIAWRVFFFGGLLAGGLALAWLHPASLPPAVLPSGGGTVLLGVAGLLVGFGTRLGNGCTSGHGVCGLARGSVRSLAATLTFMATGVATVFLVRHVL